MEVETELLRKKVRGGTVGVVEGLAHLQRWKMVWGGSRGAVLEGLMGASHEGWTLCWAKEAGLEGGVPGGRAIGLEGQGVGGGVRWGGIRGGWR